MTYRPIPVAVALSCLLATTQPLGAHPHIFVDAGLRLIHGPEAELAAVEVIWRYDELYSMLLLSDFSIDPALDPPQAEAALAAHLGFDLNWGGGFEGGLVLHQAGAPLGLGAPAPVSLRVLPNGQIESIHRRPVSGAAPGLPLEAQIYDPEFYVAFEMILATDLSRAPGCQADLIRADIDAAYAELAKAIDAIGGAVAAEDNFPAVGALFADRVVVTCPG